MEISPDERTELNMREVLLWLPGSPMSGHGPSARLIKSAHFPSCLPGSALLTSEGLRPGSSLDRSKGQQHHVPEAVGMGTGCHVFQVRDHARPERGEGPGLSRIPCCNPPHPGCQENREKEKLPASWEELPVFKKFRNSCSCL